MTQPVGRAHRADNQATDRAVQDDAAEQPRQPDTHAQESLKIQGLWTLFQIDQQRISALDTNMMTIRGWTITLVSALVGFSLSQHHRNLLPVAMVGTVLFGLLDVRVRQKQLLHTKRADKVQQAVAPDYTLYRDSVPSWLSFLQSGYYSPISFYVVMFVLLLLLWIVA